MKYAVEMDTGAMIYIPSCIKIRHSKVNRGNLQTHRQHGDHISLLSFFQNKESRLKKEHFIALWKGNVRNASSSLLDPPPQVCHRVIQSGWSELVGLERN
jgi:hypothetical protein